MCSSHHSLGACLITAFTGTRALGAPQILQASAAPSVPCPNLDFSSQYGVKFDVRISHSLETPLLPTHHPFFMHCDSWSCWAGEQDPLPSFFHLPIYFFFLNPFLFKEALSSTEVEVVHHFAYVYWTQQTGELLRSCLWWNHVVHSWEEQTRCSQGQVTSTWTGRYWQQSKISWFQWQPILNTFEAGQSSGGVWQFCICWFSWKNGVMTILCLKLLSQCNDNDDYDVSHCVNQSWTCDVDYYVISRFPQPHPLQNLQQKLDTVQSCFLTW